MVLSPETHENTHPYWYAQVIGLFHADVVHYDAKTGCIRSRKQMEFLWVRWLGTEPGYCDGSKTAKLPKVGFVPEDDDFAFGFLDPTQVIRGCHLIPDFCGGKTNTLLQTPGPTAARKPGQDSDWLNFYVMIFVDCDMFMRYHGGGIGHVDIAPENQPQTLETEVGPPENDEGWEKERHRDTPHYQYSNG
ncbi:hypothetical protein BDP27DRAFT_1242376 [Rhodocollybia butyracea]|uniref:Uncharacterized protein n=1 Tax=Rhodocollybia butyracea TaxID=206335 RepID=A0A9P5P4E1_9AGAR|nr:hypothetical protein BDP27DRAFT_1242376 [Rhodocollybia butyracea]